MARYFNNVAEAIAHYLAKNPELKLTERNLAVSALPSEYDSTPYRAVIDGDKFSETVGEYKAYCQRHEALC